MSPSRKAFGAARFGAAAAAEEEEEEEEEDEALAAMGASEALADEDIVAGGEALDFSWISKKYLRTAHERYYQRPLS